MRMRLALPAAAVLVAGLGYALVAQEKPKSAPAADPAAEAGVKKTTAAFMAAFHTGDAKAVAALWTENAEMIEADGDVFRGRQAIEKAYAEAFQARPKATAKVENGSVRFLGPTVAVAEGVLTITAPGEAEPDVTEFRAILVREGGEWKIASVKSTEPDSEGGSLEEIEWLVGNWTAKGNAGELRISYAWDENKVFINGKYTITKDGKAVSSGTQILGRKPGSGLRSWSFDSSGTTSDGVWARDGNRWVSETTGLTADGTEVGSVNVIVPLGPDAFTWQTTDRTEDGEPLPALPPVKVTRVKK